MYVIKAKLSIGGKILFNSDYGLPVRFNTKKEAKAKFDKIKGRIKNKPPIIANLTIVPVARLNHAENWEKHRKN